MARHADDICYICAYEYDANYDLDENGDWVCLCSQCPYYEEETE